MTRESTFAKDDHRNFNREGKAFDRGETFSGVDFEKGLQAVEELRALKPAEATMAQFALRWILEFDAVSVAIPGAKNPEQATANAAASDLASLDRDTLEAVRKVYNKHIRPEVHHRW
jgi:aryl-alcohol dehydrogenase-like predicted oxidoreductase